MSQTSYPTEPAAGKIGQLSDSSDNNIVSRYSAEKIPFGRFVSYDGASGKVKLPAAATDIINSTSIAVLEGVALEDPSKESAAANTLGVAGANIGAHDIGDAIPVLKRGNCFVYTETALNPSSTVYIRHTASGNNVPGNIRNDDDTENAASPGNAVRVIGTTTGAGIIEIEILL